MRNIISILYLLVTLIPEISYAQEYQFKKPRNVKQEITIMDRFYNDTVRLGDTISIAYYDNKGSKIRSIGLSDGVIDSESYYKYDQHNRLIEKMDVRRLVYGAAGGINGDLMTVVKQDSIVLLIQKYQYDHKGNLIQNDWYTFGIHLEISYRYKYDQQNRIIEEKQIHYPVPLFSVRFLPKSTEVGPNYKKVETIKINRDSYKYFKNLRICERYDSAGLRGVDTTFFIKKTIRKKVSYDTNGSKEYESKYTYNSKGQLAEYTLDVFGDYGAESDVTLHDKVKYEYGSAGMLIREEDYIKGKLSTITYYKYTR